MKNKRLIVLMWAFALLPAVLLAVFWGRLPEQVPTNWGFNGQITYGPKSTLWLPAGLTPLLAFLLQFLPRMDPKQKNYKKFQNLYDGFAAFFPLFMDLVFAIVLVETFRPGTINVGRVVSAAVAALFIVIGCIMGKIKPNWFMGIRTPWALSDPDVWNKTHRMGGWVFFLTGLVSLILSLLAPEKVFAFVLLGGTLGGCVLTYVMSYVWFKRKMEGKE